MRKILFGVAYIPSFFVVGCVYMFCKHERNTMKDLGGVRKCARMLAQDIIDFNF